MRIVNAATGEEVRRYDNVDQILQINDLYEGTYNVQISSADHSSFQGVVNIESGTIRQLEAFMPRETVKYHWTVETIEVEDITHITLESEFETDVPVPVVTMDPPVLEFADLGYGDSKVINLKVTNHGFIQVEDVLIDLPDPEGYIVEPAVDSLEILAAKSSESIPVTITRLPLDAQLSMRAAENSVQSSASSDISITSAPSCIDSGTIEYKYECGPNGVLRKVPIVYDGLPCEDNPTPPSSGVYISGGSGGFGIGGGGGGGGGVSSGPTYRYIPNPKESNTNPCGDNGPPPDDCWPELFELAQDGVIFGLGFVPGLGLLAPILDAGEDWLGDSEPAATGMGRILQAGYGASVVVLLEGEALGKVIPVLGSIPELIGDVSDLFQCIGKLESVSLQLANMADGEFYPLAKKELSATSAQQSLISSNNINDILNDDRFDGILRLNEYFTRVLDYTNFVTYILGDVRWFEVEDSTALDAFITYVSDQAFILEPIIDISQVPLPSDAPADLVDAFIEHFNRTVDYYKQGKFNLGDLEVGDNTDFIALDVVIKLFEKLAGPVDAPQEVLDQITAYDEELTNDVLQAVTEYQIEKNKQVDGVCATVKLRIEQDVVMSRTAFLGSLDIEAGDHALKNLDLDIVIYDANDNIVANNIFGVTNTALQGIGALDGAANLNADQTLHAEYTMLPSSLAAPDGPASYSIGGQISYVEDGVVVNSVLNPVEIDVLPQAELIIDYFQQRDVVGDDPFTDEIEPSNPFVLGVQIHNQGKGDASNLRIESAQPKIIENDKGLLIDFKIIGSQIDGQESTQGLNADFGDITAGDTKNGLWYLESTLQGKFVSYDAKFEHVNGLGIPKLSLIKAVNIHELMRSGDVDQDGKTDFLVNDTPDLLDAPDTLYLGNSTQAGVSVIGASISNFQPMTETATATIIPTDKSNGWDYFSAIDPGNGSYIVKSISRADGSLLTSDQFWQTDRTFSNAAVQPVYENRLHILDNQVTASYVVTYEFIGGNQPNNLPVVDSISINVDEDSQNNTIGFALPTDADGDALTITVTSLPESSMGWVTKADGTEITVGSVLSEAELQGLLYETHANANGDGGFLTYNVSDGKDSVSGSAHFTIASVNDDPILVAPLVDQAVKYDTLSWNYDASPLFSDVDAADSLNYGAMLANGAPLPAWLQIGAGSGLLTGAPGLSDRGTYAVTITATDTHGASIAASMTIAVTMFDADQLLVSTAGNDVLTGTLANDTVTYAYATAPVTVSLAVTTPQNTQNTGGAGLDTLTDIDNLIGSDFNDNLIGNTQNNALEGGAGNDTLNGGTAADSLIGGLGDDFYNVDNEADTVIENINEGTDKVSSSVTYTLSANVENLTLTGVSAINGTGNDQANIIVGNVASNQLNGGAGNDTLNGAAGADSLIGGLGDDFYNVDNEADTVIENINEGTDKVSSTVTYMLSPNVENLTLWGTSAINGTGNDLANRIVGNAASNQLNGGAGNDMLNGAAGADSLIGGLGNDFYNVDNEADTVIENINEGIDKVSSSATYTLSANVENLTLRDASAINGTGNDLANVIIGNTGTNQLDGGAGNDTLDGGLGNNVLTGGTGNDSFKFTTTGHIDKITDYNVANDTIKLENAVFTALTTTGALAASQFKIGTSALDADDFIIYNNTTGALLYDADGSGLGAAVQIATLTGGLALTNADIVVI